MTLSPQPLFRQTMGRLFHLLPRPVKDQHGALDILLSRGRCDIERGKAWTARAVGWLFKFPPAGRDLPTLVTVIAERGREIWHRDFGGQGIFTVLEPARRNGAPVIVERFGFVCFDLQLGEVKDGISMSVVGMRAFGLALPRWLWPRVKAVERAEAQRFHFDIDIDLSWGAKLIHYRGWVVPAA
jgi:uncharacterized protein DUF4166